jgi:hypothetical protein
MKMNKKNKKGQMSTVMKIILVVLVLTVSIFIYSKVTRGSTKILQCSKNGGDCVKDTCDWLTQIPALSDQAAGCKRNELCCINITQEDTIDPDCKDKAFGDPCRTDEKLYYCSKALTCISKCEFCAKNWGDTVGKKICDADDIKNVFEKNNDQTEIKHFSCSCKTKCSASEIKAGTCILLYCPSTTPETYCCLTGSAANTVKTTT